jgi:hypothetical protein
LLTNKQFFSDKFAKAKAHSKKGNFEDTLKLARTQFKRRFYEWNDKKDHAEERKKARDFKRQK